MVLVITCSCGKRLQVSDSLLGERVQCPSCCTTVLMKPPEQHSATPPAQEIRLEGAPQGVPAGTRPGCESIPQHDDDSPQPNAQALGNLIDTPVGSSQVSGPQSAPLPSIPGHEILSELGRGGMGVVYLARHIQLRRLVALKTILAGKQASDAQLARFCAEAEAVARLQHPNIVQIHEIGEHKGIPFFSLEFCPGGSLDKKVNGHPLPPREAAWLVENLANAVHAAHEHNIVHRDLKTANILLAEDGTPKITDFGLAKQLDHAGQTRTGIVMGTPSYMAPEQAGESKNVGPAVDIYALGAILYELLTGRPPFKGATPRETIVQLTNDDPVPPRNYAPQVPLDLESICLKCLKKNPKERYATASALAEELARYLTGDLIQARPIGWRERAWRLARRRPAVAGILASWAILVVVLGLAYLGRDHENPEMDAAVRRDPDQPATLDSKVHEVADGLRIDAIIEATDPKVSFEPAGAPQGFPGELHAKSFDIMLGAGKKYEIRMQSDKLDCVLIAFNKAGKQLAWNYDEIPEKARNSLVILDPATDGVYKICCASRKGTGDFTLFVKETAESPPPVPQRLSLKDGVASSNSELTNTDPLDKICNSFCRRFLVDFKKATVYQIDMKSTVFDSFLRLENAAGKQLREDDGGGGGLDIQATSRRPWTRCAGCSAPCARPTKQTKQTRPPALATRRLRLPSGTRTARRTFPAPGLADLDRLLARHHRQRRAFSGHVTRCGEPTELPRRASTCPPTGSSRKR